MGPAQVEALKDLDAYVRGSAAGALGEFGPDAKAAVLTLAEVLSDSAIPYFTWYDEPASSAAKALRAIGADAVPVLVEALKDPEGNVRGSAAVALSAIGPDAKAAVPALVEALKDSAVYVRWRAAAALGHIGPDAKAAVPTLVEALKDSDAGVRHSAAEALRAVGPDAMAALALVEALKDLDAYVRGSAAGAWGAFGPDAMPALLEALKDSDVRVRGAAAYRLGDLVRGVRIGSDSHALPYLRTAYQALLRHGYAVDANRLERTIDDLERVKRRTFYKNVFEWFNQHPTATIAASVFGLCLSWVMWWIFCAPIATALIAWYQSASSSPRR